MTAAVSGYQFLTGVDVDDADGTGYPLAAGLGGPFRYPAAAFYPIAQVGRALEPHLQAAAFQPGPAVSLRHHSGNQGQGQHTVGNDAAELGFGGKGGVPMQGVKVPGGGGAIGIQSLLSDGLGNDRQAVNSFALIPSLDARILSDKIIPHRPGRRHHSQSALIPWFCRSAP